MKKIAWRKKWMQLNTRERYVVVLGGFFCLSLVIYGLIYQPLQRQAQQKQQQLLNKILMLQNLQHQLPLAKSEHIAAVIKRNELLTVIADEFNKGSLYNYTYELQQSGDHDIQLTMAEVPYLKCINWLHGLTHAYKISILQLDVASTKVPGVVRVTLKLKAG